MPSRVRQTMSSELADARCRLAAFSCCRLLPAAAAGLAAAAAAALVVELPAGWLWKESKVSCCRPCRCAAGSMCCQLALARLQARPAAAQQPHLRGCRWL